MLSNANKTPSLKISQGKEGNDLYYKLGKQKFQQEFASLLKEDKDKKA